MTIPFNEFHAEGQTIELGVDKLIYRVVKGDMSNTTTYFQVKLD